MNVSPKTPTILSSREFNQDTARAKRAAKNGPVVIMDRGRATHVLISIEEYERLKTEAPDQDEPRNLVEALAQKDGGDFDFDLPEFKGGHSLKPPIFDLD